MQTDPGRRQGAGVTTEPASLMVAGFGGEDVVPRTEWPRMTGAERGHVLPRGGTAGLGFAGREAEPSPASGDVAVRGRCS